MERVEIVKPHVIHAVNAGKISIWIVAIAYIGICSINSLPVDNPGACEGEKRWIVFNIVDCLRCGDGTRNICENKINSKQSYCDQ